MKYICIRNFESYIKNNIYIFEHIYLDIYHDFNNSNVSVILIRKSKIDKYFRSLNEFRNERLNKILK